MALRHARWPAVALGAWGLAAVAAPQGAPPGVVLIGAVLGSASALTAVGLVLIWRSARIVNFAVGAMGAATGLSAIRLHTAWGWPYPVALVVGVAAGVVVGVAVELVVMRRFVRASHLVATVATLGLAQLLGGIELVLPGAIFGEDTGVVTVGGFETPLSSTRVVVGAHVIDGNHLLIVGLVPLLVGSLAWFLRRSLVGTAIRGAAENRDWARLLGIDVGALSVCTWAVAGGFAAATYMLQAPFLGTVPQATAGPTALMIPLAAALVARLESIPVACVAAIALGSVDQLVRWNSPRTPALADVVLLAVILGALLIGRPPTNRARDAGGGWGPVPARVRPAISPTLLGAAQVGGVALAVAAAVGLPQLLSESTAYTFSIAAVWGMVAVSIVVVTGWTGQLSLGQFAIVGLAATVAGNLAADGADLIVVVAAAVATGMVTAGIIGVPALRIRGPFLGIATLAFALVVDGYVLNPNYFPDLLPDDIGRPVILGRWPLEREQTMLSLTLLCLVASVVAAASVRGARSGRHLLAARDNPRALEAQGVSARAVALRGFVFSGAVAGMAGAMHVLILHGVRLGSYRPVASVESFSATTIGGLTSLWGAVTTTVGLRAAQDSLSTEVRLATMGVGVLLVLWLFPSGLSGVPAAVRARLARRRAEPVVDLAAAASGANGATPNGVSAATTARLASRDLDVSFGSLQVLFGVDIDVADGEILALLGTNGAGKSTWLKAVMGLVPSSGSVTLAGGRVSRRSPERMVRRRVALMMGGQSTFPTLTVAEHLRLAGWIRRRHDAERLAADGADVLDLFPALRHRLDSPAGNLSGGEQQQLALGQTLLLRPDVLLIDELSLGLSPIVVGELTDVLADLHAAGVTIVVVEQSVNVAMTLAQRAVFMEKGQVRYDGPTAELLDRPDLMRSIFFDAADAAADTTVDTIVGAPVAHPPVVECSGVTKRFGGIVAIHEVSLRVAAGEIVGLIGQNGAGKSTLLDCLSGFQSIDEGDIAVRGRDVSGLAPWERALSGMGRTFQEARLFPALTVAETVAVARERHVANRSMVADALRQPRSWRAEAETVEAVDALLAELGLTGYRDTPTAALSTGTRRVVEMACLLAAEPSAMLLDEPSAGVAQRETEALGPLLRRVRDATGAAIVIVEHDMALLRSVCDRLVAMNLGAVVADGPPEDVLADPFVIACYLGSNASAIERSGSALSTA